MRDTATPGAVLFWNAKAAEYDDYIRRVVPRYDEQLDALFACLPSSAQRVLELGCGTGNVSQRLADYWPDARFTFVDAAPEMLDITRARIAERHSEAAARCEFVLTRFETLSLDRNAYDVIVASLSLHHVQDIATVYPRLAPALASDGRLVMLDGIRAVTDELQRMHMLRWAAFWHGRLTADEQAEVTDHIRQHDVYRTFPEHVALLDSAGFTDVDCVWRDGLFALVTARRRDTG